MLNSFIIVLREGFEAFLVVAIMTAYLRKTDQKQLLPAVYAAVVASIGSSLALGYVLRQGVNEALWEAILGIIAVVLVGHQRWSSTWNNRPDWPSGEWATIGVTGRESGP